MAVFAIYQISVAEILEWNGFSALFQLGFASLRTHINSLSYSWRKVSVMFRICWNIKYVLYYCFPFVWITHFELHSGVCFFPIITPS